MILCTLMDSGGGKGERAGVGFKGEGIWKGQFGNEIKRYSTVVAHGRTLLDDPSSPPLSIPTLVNPPLSYTPTSIIPTPRTKSYSAA